jgi:hypothetical protein
MGRRSRKRASAPAPTYASPADADATASPRPAAPRRRARAGEAPKPIWAPFPLVELAILLGLVFIAGGLIWGGAQGRTLLACGVVVVCLAALELAIREHVTGYRSHSALLALVPAAVTVGVLFMVVELPGSPGIQRAVGLGVAAAVFLICFLALRELFRRRSGGLSFRA